jgi:uncharacterized membrane protein YfcA
MKKRWCIWISGASAGAVNGLLGAGGGMVLVPLMTLLTELREDEIFPASISMILPICLVSLTVNAMNVGLPWRDAFPYLIGSAAGGLLSGLLGRKIPVKWLHRLLGLLVLWGGIRYLC